MIHAFYGDYKQTSRYKFIEKTHEKLIKFCFTNLRLSEIFTTKSYNATEVELWDDL